MTSHILKCPACGSYGLTEACSCGDVRVTPKPPKYSPEDKYAAYRRKYKEEHPEAMRRPAGGSAAAKPMPPLEAKRQGLR